MNGPNASILRFFKGKSVVGTGFLATDLLAVTCAHVLQAAGADIEDSVVKFDFPMGAPEEIVSGRVLFLDVVKDIAILEITNKLPKGVVPSRIVKARNPWGHKFRAFGFPSKYDNGVWVTGEFRGLTADGLLQIEDIKETGFRVQQGFSGGPVWDEQLQAIVGMVVTEEQDPSIKAGFCIPASSIESSYPNLKFEEAELASKPVPRVSPLLKMPTGRDDILNRLVAKFQKELTNRDSAIIALWGMAGVGKTTLAIALANRPEIESALPDGTLWVSLGPKPDAMSLLAIWARQLDQDVTDYPSPETKSRALATILHDKKMLIVIDDVWDVNQAHHFLIGGPKCRLLITTRDRQAARALAFQEIYPVENLTELGSLELLEKLAPRAVASDKDSVSQLITLLGGLPLALTITGQLLEEEWEAGLGTSGFLHELQEREKRLKLKLSDESSTLDALFGLSYEHLPSDRTQRAFRQLGVFGGKPNTFSIEAASAIWEMELRDTQKTLGTLVKRALIEVMDIDNHRYAPHALLADYAASLLDQSKEEKLQAYRCHSGYFLNVARQYTRENMENWHYLDIDWHNIRLDADWLSTQMNQPDPEGIETQSMADYISALDMLVQIRKPLESEKWLQAGKKAYQKLGRAVDEAWLLLTQGQLALDRGFLEQAVENFSQSAKLFESNKEGTGLVYAQGNLGAVHMIRGEYPKAKILFEKANELCEEAGDDYGLSVGHYNLGSIFHELNKTRKSISHLRESIDLCRKIGRNKNLLVKALGLFGKMLAATGDVDQALKNGQEAYEIAYQSDSKPLQGIVNQRIGEIYAHKDSEEADSYFRVSIQLLKESSVEEELAEAHAAYGKFLAQRREYGEAKIYLSKAIQIFEHMGITLRTKKIKKILRNIENL
jgi:tetratricopeptide (TPR) repeat protein